MSKLLPINDVLDIPLAYRKTPIGLLLEYHNLSRPFENHPVAELLVGMCMDNRKRLNIPAGFAYVLRTGGGNLRFSEFKVSYSIGIGEVTAIALLGHDNCGMVNLISKREQFVAGLVRRAGWSPKRALDHFVNFAPMFEIDNEVNFVTSEAIRLREKYPGILVAPLMYLIEDNRLYLLQEEDKLC